MTKLFALFSSGSSVDELIETLNQSDVVSDVTVYGNAAVDNDPVAATVALATPLAISQTGAGVIMSGSELEAEGLSSEVADYFSRSLEGGAQIVVVETSDTDSIKAMLENAGGRVSEGG